MSGTAANTLTNEFDRILRSAQENLHGGAAAAPPTGASASLPAPPAYAAGPIGPPAAPVAAPTAAPAAAPAAAPTAAPAAAPATIAPSPLATPRRRAWVKYVVIGAAIALVVVVACICLRRSQGGDENENLIDEDAEDVAMFRASVNTRGASAAPPLPPPPPPPAPHTHQQQAPPPPPQAPQAPQADYYHQAQAPPQQQAQPAKFETMDQLIQAKQAAAPTGGGTAPPPRM